MFKLIARFYRAVKVENQRQRVQWHLSRREIERTEMNLSTQRIKVINAELAKEERKLACMLRVGVKP
jgi:hypothetical protein